MKNTLIFFVSLILLAALFPSRVQASEKEAGEAARLVSFVASESAEQKAEDVRIKKLEAYLSHYNSPLASQAHTFVEEADKHGIDWRLLVSIAGVESTFGQFIPTGSYNPFGWGVFTGKSYGVNFKDWQDAIATVSDGLKTKYVDKGATTIDRIGYIYAASSAWSNHVRFFMNDLDTFALPQETIGKVIAMTL